MENSKIISLPVILKGDNYLLWSRVTKTCLCSRGLWNHIEAEVVQTETSSNVQQGSMDGDGATIGVPASTRGTTSLDKLKWFQEDQMVLSILQSSLDQPILAAYSFSETAKELWETLQSVFGNTSNLSRIFEIKRALNNLQQGEKTFTQHFGEYRALWAELETLRPPTNDRNILNERREQDQIFGLLSTLHSSFNDLIYHVLRADKLPSLNEVCMQIQKEEGSKGLFGLNGELVSANKSFFKKGDKSNKVIWCEHCKKKGHPKDKCWILNPHLKPTKFKNAPNAMMASSSAPETSGDEWVKKSDLESLIKAFASQHTSGNTSGNISKCHKPIIVDSGASHHMISDINLLENIEPASGNVIIANGQNIPVKGIGDLKLFNKNSKAFFMPEFTSNLLSVQKATNDLDCLAIFSTNDLLLQDTKTGKRIGEGVEKDGLYVLNNKNLIYGSANNAMWHARLGHPHVNALKIMLPNISFDHTKCEACILGKHCKSVFPRSISTYKHCFDLIHSDVWTSPCVTRDQHKYFVTFIDEKSKYTWLTLLPSKDRVFEAFSNFYSFVFTQYNTKIKILRTDNGGEYTSKEFKAFTAKCGIIHQTTCPYTPQQNGVSERKNRHLMEVARTIMFFRNVPKYFWGDAVTTACHLINRIPTKSLDDLSPFEILNKHKPSIDHFKIFGCVCYVFVPGNQRNKLQPKSIKCIFIGYSPSQKGYKCFHPETKRVFVSRDVKFDEDQGYYQEKDWDKLKDLTSSQTDLAAHLRTILESIQKENTNVSSGSTGNQHEKRDDDNHSTWENLQELGENSPDNFEEDLHEEEDNDSHGTKENHQGPSEDSHGDSDDVPHDFHTESEDQGDYVPVEIHEQNETHHVHQTHPSQELRRSNRIRKDPSNWINTRVYYNNMAVSHPIQDYLDISMFPTDHKAFIAKIDQEFIPRTYEEAKDHIVWQKAMEEEHNAMNKNDTWTIVDLPRDKKLVGSKWVYTIKYTSKGDIERHKARLVAKGFTQTYGEDYKDTFAPVAKLHTVRVLLSLATNFSWDLWQMDVKNAFLQGELEEEVYMRPPPGLEDTCKNGQVLKLKKAIYGLKQSPRAWYHKLSSTLFTKGFKRSESDHSLFTIQGERGIVIILIYVDDIIITGDDNVGIQQTKSLLKSAFDIKDLGELRYFLGIEVCRFSNGLFLSQRKYILDLLSETGKIGAKPAKTPIEEGYKDQPKGEPITNIGQYQRIVGKLIYLTITRPDICFSVNQVSQHMQSPTTQHWGMVERILKYLKGTPTKGIWMHKNDHAEIIGYCDADWAGDKQDRKSTSGYCTFVGGNLVTWKSKKQTVVSRSSAEAEYRAMANATDELIWLKALLHDLGFKTSQGIIMHCDNQAAIHIASNSVFHERTKHIEVDCHHIREKVQLGIITPTYTRSSDQLADIFTKAASSKVCDHIHSKLGLMDLPAKLEGEC